MRYFKDQSGQVFGYDEDGSQDDLIAAAVEAGYEDITGAWPPAPVVNPVAENIAAIQRELDRQAQAKGYDSIFTAALRAGFPGPFHDEGVAFAQWMDATWSHAYTVLAQVQAGAASMPTPDEAVAMMPALVLP